MEKENKLNINELVSLPITTFDGLYNAVAHDLNYSEKMQILILANSNVSEAMKKLMTQKQESFNDFYDAVSTYLNETEKRLLLISIRMLAKQEQSVQNEPKTIVREKTMHKKDNVL